VLQNKVLQNKGSLEKLSFRPNPALRAKNLSLEYQLYGCGKIFTRALILKENPNFARYPKIQRQTG
jgi:hypothetical protein